MGQESKNQVLTVRKVQVPVQKTLQEDTEMVWGCQHLGQVWRIQLIPASLGPGQHGHDLAHGLQRWLKTATFLPLSCVGQSAGIGREIILPEQTTARRGSPSWAQGIFLLAAWSGMLRSSLGAEPSRGLQELTIRAYSPRTPPYQAPRLASCFLELCLLPQRLEIKLCGFLLHFPCRCQ